MLQAPRIKHRNILAAARSLALIGLGVSVGFAAPASAREPGEMARWRFDFGDGATAHGYVRVAAATTYSEETGFGFEPGSSPPKSVVRDGRPLQGDFITADQALQFSVRVPEGDYRVTILLGDARGSSETTIRAETRRLMIERATTTDGQFAREHFIVNVRNAALAPPPANAPGAASVRLDSRETGSLNWDSKLTLEFSGLAAKTIAVEIEAVEAPRVFLLGDSTVADQEGEPYASWGQMLPRFFGAEIAIANHAQSGHSLKSFLTSLRLDKALGQMRPGDWALIQFGHNDQKQQWPQTYAPAETTFRDYLRAYVDEIRRHGARPVLVTPVQRRTFDAQGRIENSLGGYPEAIRIVAREADLPLIDLHAISAEFYEALGPERARLAFALDGQDATHHNDYGAYELARRIVHALRLQTSPLARHLRADKGVFDPAVPDPPDKSPCRRPRAG